MWQAVSDNVWINADILILIWNSNLPLYRGLMPLGLSIIASYYISETRH